MVVELCPELRGHLQGAAASPEQFHGMLHPCLGWAARCCWQQLLLPPPLAVQAALGAVPVLSAGIVGGILGCVFLQIN